MSWLTEFDSYITPDGRLYPLTAPEIRWVRSIEGTGMPPIEYITQRGPFQHGETVLGHRLRPRVIQMHIRQNFRSRDEYYNGRLQILDVLRPNRVGETGTLRKSFKNGSKIDIDVMIQQGPNFQPQAADEWDAWSFDEIIRFIAYNPVFYNPYMQTHEFINSDIDDTNLTQLVFPITYPITFHRSGHGLTSEGNLTVPYAGTWVEYPTIALIGPLGNPVYIENVTTGELLRYNRVVDAGETVTIELTYGIKTIESSSGLNVMPFLDENSDLGSFHLEPGDNTFLIGAIGFNALSGLELRYHDRFIGY